MLNMPGGSSAAKDEPDRTGAPSSLQGAMSGTVGSASQGDLVIDPVMGSPANMHATASVAEGAHWQEKYSLLVHIFTARDRWALEPYAWAEDLLKDFFQLTLGINLLVTLLSPTGCLIFCGNHTQGQGMSWNESLHYAHQLTGIHPWAGYTIDVVAFSVLSRKLAMICKWLGNSLMRELNSALPTEGNGHIAGAEVQPGYTRYVP